MTKVTSLWRSHPLVVVGLSILVLCIGAAGWIGASALRSDPVEVDWAVPDAEALDPGPGQTLYRVDPSRSSARYEVEETVAGRSGTAIGTTKGIAGDVVVDVDDPSNSQIGEIVVNVEQLTSDNRLRDDRIRKDFLRSDDFPLARYVTESIDGLPETITDGTDYDLVLHGELTLKDVTQPVEVAAVVRRTDGELSISGSAQILMSDFGVGPINLIGLARTGNEATFAFDLVMPEAADLDIVEREPVVEELLVAGPDDPQFSETVQPVLEAKCASCHQPGGAGSGTWVLASAGDAARVASGIGLAVQSGYMPPWLASEESASFKYDLSLSDDELAAILEWTEAGGPLDVDPATKVEADDLGGPELRTDMDLRMPEPYVGDPDLKNDYRCYVLDPELTAPAGITGYEFVPDHLPIVHHALVYRVPASARAALDEAEARDDEAGWECFGTINVSGAGISPSSRGGGSDLVMGWAPGQPASIFEEGSAIKLDPGDLLVMQMHYHVSEDAPPDQSSMRIQLAEGDLDDYDDIQVHTYLAPAEIPCLPEDADAPRCDREVEMEALLDQYGPMGPGIANGLLGVCGTTHEEIGVLDEDGIAYSSCEHRVGRDKAGDLVAVLGHMHEIGKTFRMTLNPGTPEEKVLLDIPRWDFDWQFNYALDEEITLEPDDVIRVECSWDRTMFDPTAEPHWVSWAEGTEDEMCYSTVATRVTDD